MIFNRRQFEVGDVIQIREWDDMANEFKIEEGRIVFDEDNTFTKRDKDYCGNKYKILSINNTVVTDDGDVRKSGIFDFALYSANIDDASSAFSFRPIECINLTRQTFIDYNELQEIEE